MNITWTIIYFIIELFIIISIFTVLVIAIKWIYNKLISNEFLMSSKYLNPTEYLPNEEILSLKQVYYLIMVVLFLINFLYIYFNWGSEAYHLIYVDVILSVFVAMQLDLSSKKNKIVFLMLVPYAALCYLTIPYSNVHILDLIHGLVFIYLIKVFIERFMEYTETNSLGITIMLLFSIVFVSFLITMPVEGVSPLNSIEMVSNAFTSNGYAILGNSAPGKLNAVFLVWSGFILSSVGTATMTASIIKRHLNKSFDDLEETIKKKKKN